MEIWISEKLQMAMEESYKDPSNIQSKHQKHQAFEAELAANADRIQTTIKMGQSEWCILLLVLLLLDTLPVLRTTSKPIQK